MAIFKDDSNFKLRGLFQVKLKNTKTGKEVLLDEENLVVSQARTLMRDLVADVSDTRIKRIQIGDLNKDLSDSLSNCPDPEYSDSSLTNAFFSKDFESRETITYDDRPAIKYTFVINEDEANDSSNNDNERKLWCEYALISTTTDSDGNEEDGKIWNRKIKPIIKDDETIVTVYWIFIF